MKVPTREEAKEILERYTKNSNLIKHALAVEAAMRHYARLFGEDEEIWGVVGLLHDFDYELHPSAEEHPYRAAEILREMGYDDSLAQTILSHASYTKVPRHSKMARTLFAVDELCGLITAVALVRPNKSLAEVEVKSVKKKMKDKAFARNVNRDEIRAGAAELGVPLDEHIANVIAAMRAVAPALGL